MATNGTNGGNGNNGNTGPAKKAPATRKAAAAKAKEAALRVRREALGLSRQRVADEAEIAVSAVWRSEHEESGVDDETRDRIVGVLNAHRDEIAKLPRLH